MKTITKLVPDTSVIIEGILSKRLENKQIKFKELIIHEAVIAELESQANKNRETGYLGLEEVKKLKELEKKRKFKISFKGSRPKDFEIKYAKSGEIDSLIRSIAFDEKATLITADRVQSLVAEAKGINVVFIEIETVSRKIKLEKYFDEKTMSVHIRENTKVFAKKGMPGKWKFEEVSKKALTRDEVRNISKEIIEETNIREDGFIELERRGSTIVQLGNYRIVITRPPFADGYEITAVRPVKKLELKDYELAEKLDKRIKEQAEGILIAGAPGHGKSTFAQALAEYYASQEKIVKTVEAPRDLTLPDSVTQYAISHGSAEEVHDVLLLSRPDYTIFDEMRNTKDFRLFSDLRLSGVGMIGVVHATNPVDAIQRFIGRIELGVIPQIMDTVIFIKNGAVDKVYSVVMQVRVPAGMTEADLARPVVTVSDFNTGKAEFEIYSYGEETVVVPITESSSLSSPAKKIAAQSLENAFTQYTDRAKVDIISDNKCKVYVPAKDIARIIGKQGSNIDKLEKNLGIKIDVEPLEEAEREEKQDISFSSQVSKKYVQFMPVENYVKEEVDVYLNGQYLMSAKVGKKNIVKINKKNKVGKILVDAINTGEKIELKI
jgi:ATPase